MEFWLAVLVTVLLTEPGLGLEDDVHPAITTVERGECHMEK